MGRSNRRKVQPLLELAIRSTEGNEWSVEMLLRGEPVEVPSPDGMELTEASHTYLKLNEAVITIQMAIKPSLTQFINEYVPAFLQANDMSIIGSKRRLAAKLMACANAHGYYFRHPETGSPCLLLVVSDKWGGKFMLENRITRKRSCSNSDIFKMLPLQLVGYRNVPV